VAFDWTKKRIEWFLDASRYGNFYEQLAKIITPFLYTTDTVVDLGCGLGRLDLQIASSVSHITSVDINADVLGILQEDARKKGIKNLSVQCCDAQSIQEKFDVVLMTFFGYPPSLMLNCMALAKKITIRVVHAGDNTSALRAKKWKKSKETIKDISSVLEKEGLKYQLVRDSFEFGQPLRSKSEGLDFIRCNSPEMPENKLREFVEANLETTGNAEFPFYLPAHKDLGIFVIFR